MFTFGGNVEHTSAMTVGFSGHGSSARVAYSTHVKEPPLRRVAYSHSLTLSEYSKKKKKECPNTFKQALPIFWVSVHIYMSQFYISINRHRAD